MELHILITQDSFNTAHETHLYTFYVHFPSSERQSRLPVWNYGARRGAIGLDSLSSHCTSILSDTLLKRGTAYKKHCRWGSVVLYFCRIWCWHSFASLAAAGGQGLKQSEDTGVKKWAETKCHCWMSSLWERRAWLCPTAPSWECSGAWQRFPALRS